MNKPHSLERLRPGLGTYLRIHATGEHPARLSAAVEAAFAQIAAVEARLSWFRPDSELSRLNRSLAPMRVHPNTARLLHWACQLAELSAHRFNPTVGGALVERGRLPDPGGAFLPVGCAADLHIHGTLVQRLRPVMITLDGIAKGWAVDRAIATLRANGVRRATVNAGGDWRCIGRSEAITRPHPQGRLTLGQLTNGACATSAAGLDAARFPALLLHGQAPVAPGEWTVIAPTAWRADALTKIAAASDDDDDAAAWVARCGGQLIHAPAAQLSARSHAA